MLNYEIELEKEFQNRIHTTKDIKEDLLKLLNIESECKFLREVEFINGITSDFIVYDINTNEMKAIIECKRADIGVTEYVRGVGQLFQYEYFQEKKILPHKYKDIRYNSNINNNILLIPSDFIKNTNLNIGRFKYPKNSIIFEIHSKNNRIRKITTEELEKLAEAVENNLTTISQYYVRDNRLFECYIAFKVIALLNNFSISMNRPDIEEKLLRKIEVINNRNWRNAFITLSSLGLIGDRTIIYDNKLKFTNMDIINFINFMYKDYLYPFIDVIMEKLNILSNNNKEVDVTNRDLAKMIREIYGGKDVLFLSDSDSRYISSWLNIMRDDLGCISFEPRKSLRKINYIPKELNEIERINKIKQFSIAQKYVDKFNEKKLEIFKGVLNDIE